MMKILALETATMQGSLAILDDDTLVAEYSLNIKATHSERLIPAVHTVLTTLGLEVSDLDGFAVSLGPGSFTGLRIGLSTVKGFGFATGKPVVGVSTLAAMAYQFAHAAPLICPCLDARKKEIYTALYDLSSGHAAELISPCAVDPRTFMQQVKESTDRSILFLGDGVNPYRAVMEEVLADRAVFAPPFAAIPRAGTVAALGMIKLRAGHQDDIVNLEPIYLRKSEAEIKWLERQ